MKYERRLREVSEYGFMGETKKWTEVDRSGQKCIEVDGSGSKWKILFERSTLMVVSAWLHSAFSGVVAVGEVSLLKWYAPPRGGRFTYT